MGNLPIGNMSTDIAGRSCYPGMPELELARTYVMVQVFGEIYPLPEALCKGTIFPELYRPYPPMMMK